MRKLIATLLLALAFASPAIAQPCGPIPALPDTERRTEYTGIVAQTGPFNVGFQLYGDSTDVGNWLEVWVNGVKKTITTDFTVATASGPAIGSACLPISNAQVTFLAAQTGTIEIVGARRPRRASQFSENAGVTAHALNQVISDLTAAERERWDLNARQLRGIPGEVIQPLPSAATRAGKFLYFDATGLIPQATSGGAGTGNVVGPPSSTVGHVAVWGNTTGTLLANGGLTIFSPEQFGAVGDNTADDTVPWQNMCAAVVAAGGGQIIAAPNKTYKVWPSTPTTQSVLCNLGAANGVSYISNGSSIHVAYTGTAITYIFLHTGGSSLLYSGLKGTADTGKHVSGDTTGVHWVLCSNQGASIFGCRNLRVEGAEITGGLTGVAITRTFGTGLWSQNIHVDGRFTNIGYPVANEADGLNTDFDIVTVNAGRSYIGYNVWGVRGTVNSQTGNSLNDIDVGVFGFQNDLSLNATSNIDIKYVNRESTTYGASLFSLTHSQADPVNANIASTISNVRFLMDVVFNSTPSVEVLEEASLVGTSLTLTPGDLAGNRNNNIVLEGRIAGEVAPSFLGCMMTASNGNCSGFSGLGTGTYVLRNLQVPTSTKPWAIGVGATVTFAGYSQPSGNFPTFDGGYDFGHLSLQQPVTFANTGSEPVQGTTNFWDQSGAGTAIRVRNGGTISLYRTDGTLVGNLGTGPGNPVLSSAGAFALAFGVNSAINWNILTSPNGGFVPNIDNTYQIGTASLRPSNVFGTIGTFNSVVLPGSSSGSLTIVCAAACGSNTLTLPAGTTNFSATGGTSQVVQQTSAGGAFTVGQLAFSNISGTIATGQVSGSYTGITGVGTITVGTWNAGTVTSSGLVQAAATSGYNLGSDQVLFVNATNYTKIISPSAGGGTSSNILLGSVGDQTTYIRASNIKFQDAAGASTILYFNASTNKVYMLGILSGNNDVGLEGNSARSFGSERHTTSNTAGNDLTVTAGGATSGATNKAGGNLLLKPGVSTGSGVGETVLYSSPGTAGATSDNTLNEVLRVLGAGNIKFSNAASFSANNTVATVLGSVGPTGSHTTVQKWLTIVDSTGATLYIPAF